MGPYFKTGWIAARIGYGLDEGLAILRDELAVTDPQELADFEEGFRAYQATRAGAPR